MGKRTKPYGLIYIKAIKSIFKSFNSRNFKWRKLDKDKISTKNEEVLIDTLEYSSKEIKKLKKNKLLVILLTILITIILIILIDTLQAIIFKNSPIISWRVADKNDSDSYIDKGILINTYYCVKEEDIVTVIPTFKNTNYNCPQE